jgi:hypothetical protein
MNKYHPASCLTLAVLLIAGGLRADDAPTPPATIERAGYWSTVLNPGGLAKAGLGVAFDHANDRIDEWGSGPGGLGKRTALDFGTQFSRLSVEYWISGALHTDVRYQRCRCGGFALRARHAVVHEFIEHRADGSLAPPISRFAGIYAANLAAVPFLPGRYGVRYALERGTVTPVMDIGFTMIQEFAPEIKRTLLRGWLK